MLDNLEQESTQEMEKALEALKDQLKKIRTGRAQVSMLDSIKVNYYGTPTPLSQVATLSTPDARSFTIAPWEATILKEIEAALVKSDLGMSPQNDGKIIRLRVPELTEERRKQLVKSVKKIIEDARVAVRMARRNSNDEIKKALKDKTISEDDKKRLEDQIQKITDDYIAKVDKISDDKEKELLTV